MQEMLDAQQTGVARAINGLRKLAGVAVDLFGAFLAPNSQRIEYSGDAAGGDLRVIGDYGRHGVPMNFRTRHDMRFQMIGVQFDKAGQQQIAAKINAALGRLAFADLRDQAIADNDIAAFDHAVAKNDAGILKDDGAGVGHVVYPAIANCVTSTAMSAISSRTSLSCTMATMAAPCCLRSRTMSTTTARLLASSEAVGSSSSRMGCSGSSPRARLMRCCSPPENVAGGRIHSRSGTLKRCSIAAARSMAVSRGTNLMTNGSATMSRADTRGTARRNCVT